MTAIALNSFAVFGLVRACARWVELRVAGAGQVRHTQAPSALVKVGERRTRGHGIRLLQIQNIPKTQLKSDHHSETSHILDADWNTEI